MNKPRLKVNDYDQVIDFGKFKGETFGWIASNEPSYIVWLNDEGIVEFSEEIIEAAEFDDAQNSPPEFWIFPDLGSK